MAELAEVMSSLAQTLDHETELLRSGRLAPVAELAAAKEELSRRYIAAVTRLRGNAGFRAQIAPDGIAALRRGHATLQALLQANLTVLATAHAVSEGIVRGVSGELARRCAPATYGASGRPSQAGYRGGNPLAVSRVS